MTHDHDAALRERLSALSGAANAPLDVARRDVIARITRRRARRTVVVGGLAVAALTGALTFAARFGNASPAVNAPATTVPSDVEGELRLLAVEARGGPSGTERVVLEFSGPLPEPGSAGYVPELATGADDRVTFTTQGTSSGTLQICGTPHDAAGVKTIDILIPAAWLDPGDGLRNYLLRPDPTGDEGHFERVGKIIPCWNPVGLAQIVVTRSAWVDRARIGVEVVDHRIVLEILPE